MLTENETDQIARTVTDAIEVDEFVSPSDSAHHDQYVQYTHELPEDDAEATSRVLVRVVPVTYGALFGGVADNMLLGLATGLAVGMVFDLYMGSNSMLRSLARSLLSQACPAVTTVAHRLAGAIARLGLKAPSTLRDMRCRVAQS